MSFALPALFSSTAAAAGTAGAASATGSAIGMASAMTTGTASALSAAGMVPSAFSWGSALTTLGLGASALSSIAGGYAQSEALRSNAAMAEQQALYAEDKAARDSAAEKREAGRQMEVLRQQQRQERGRRMAAWGASGVQMSGSPLRVMEGIDATQDRDVAVLLTGSLARRQNILYSGRAEARASRAQASLYRSQAGTAVSGGWLKGLSTLALGSQYYG